MFRGCILASTCVLALASASHGDDTHPFSVMDMQAMQRVSDPRPSPDGKLVAFVIAQTDLDANKRNNDLFVADVGGAWARRMTLDPAADTSPRWAPDGSAIYFLSTRSGSQQVWRLRLDGGEPERITNEPLDVDALEVSPDGGTLFYSMAVFPGTTTTETRTRLDAAEKSKSSGRIYDQLFIRHWDTWSDGTRNHLFAYALPAGPAKDLMLAMPADCPSKPFGGSEEYAISPDGKNLVFSCRNVGREEAWSTNFDLYTVPTDGKVPPRPITTNPAWDTQPRFSPNGETLGWLAMDRAGFEADRFHFVIRDLRKGTERRIDVGVSGKRGDRSPGEWVWSEDGKELYWGADHFGQHALFATTVSSGKSRILVDDGTVVGPQALPGGRIVYGLNSLMSPTELFVVTARSPKPQQFTRMNIAAVRAARFGKPEQFRFVGAHGDSVYGYLVRPVDFKSGAKYPVAFLIHGGPQGSFGNDFHYRWNPQAYAGAGYAVVMIDFHGSTGYGQAFTDAIRGDWGGAPYDDLMIGLDFALAKWSFLDADHVGALGASYGGYMINWIAGKTDRFKCLVSHDGTLNERMGYFDTEELWFPEWEYSGTPWENPDAYTKHSPDQLVQNWKTPMLVIHSGKDFRVVETQGLSVFTALQRRAIPSKLLYFPDENHWVLKPQNSILWHQTVIGWLDQWLKGTAQATR